VLLKVERVGALAGTPMQLKRISRYRRWAIELTETELNDFLVVRTAGRNNQPVGKRIDGGENLL